MNITFTSKQELDTKFSGYSKDDLFEVIDQLHSPAPKKFKDYPRAKLLQILSDHFEIKNTNYKFSSQKSRDKIINFDSIFTNTVETFIKEIINIIDLKIDDKHLTFENGKKYDAYEKFLSITVMGMIFREEPEGILEYTKYCKIVDKYIINLLHRDEKITISTRRTINHPKIIKKIDPNNSIIPYPLNDVAEHATFCWDSLKNIDIYYIIYRIICKNRITAIKNKRTELINQLENTKKYLTERKKIINLSTKKFELHLTKEFINILQSSYPNSLLIPESQIQNLINECIIESERAIQRTIINLFSKFQDTLNNALFSFNAKKFIVDHERRFAHFEDKIIDEIPEVIFRATLIKYSGQITIPTIFATELPVIAPKREMELKRIMEAFFPRISLITFNIPYTYETIEYDGIKISKYVRK